MQMAPMTTQAQADARRDTPLSLICRLQRRLCALPLANVVETMRPLPVNVVPGAPHFVRGLAVVRGAPIPVVDAGRLLGLDGEPPARFVTLTVENGRRIALAVDAVLGIRSIPPEALHELPPLLKQVESDTVSQIGMLDAELLMVLQSARLVPEDFWSRLDARGSA